MTIKKYLQSNDLETTTHVTATGKDEKGSWLRVETTLFHPQGGGQRADMGTIDGLQVFHVSHTPEGDVNHYVRANDQNLIPNKEIKIQVDKLNRFRNAQLHSGGHFISAVVEDIYPDLQAIGGHHWPGESRVEFKGVIPDIDELSTKLRAEIQRQVRNELIILVKGAPYSSRKIKIGSYPSVPCGGTHLANTNQLDGLIISGVKVKKGKLRISYEINVSS